MARTFKDVNLRFITAGQNETDGLVKYLQGIFGQLRGVVRKTGIATVLSGQTTIAVADTLIAAGDLVDLMPTAQGATPGTFVSSIAVNAGVGFTVTVNQNPGAGGFVFSWWVTTPIVGP